MITIIGVGALGSHVALALRNEKTGLKVVDFDRVERKNTYAQFHTIMKMGANKAQALQQSFMGLFGVTIYSVPYKLLWDNAEALLETSKLVIDCTDNLDARNVISGACHDLKLPLLHGALAASGDFARVIWSEHFKADAEPDGDGTTCVDGDHLPFYLMASAFLALEAQNFLKTGKKRSWQLSPAGVTRLA